MSLLPDTNVNYNDFSSLSRLRVDAREDSQAALKEVAKQFESVFVQMMIKSMREASVPLQGELFNSQQSKAYTDMYDKQLGLELTKTNGIGLADVIVRQLSKPGELDSATGVTNGINNLKNQLATIKRQSTSLTFKAEKTDTVIEDSNSIETVSVNKFNHHSNLQVTEQQQSPHWQRPEDFIKDSWPHAQRAAEALGVDPRAILAQSALETGWGKKIHATDAGENSYSLFGIKADQRWQGKTVQFSTLEFESGAMQRQNAQFRAYDSLAASYKDYVEFLQSNPRYQQVFGADTVKEFSRALQDAGYATDPNYANKINRISEGELINETVSALKVSSERPLT